MVVVLVKRKMGKGRWRSEAFCTRRGQTWHVSDPAQGPRNLLWQNTPSIRSGRSGKPEFHSGV